ncbi:hypothetical protein KDI_01660 [Dictyobacter arantiisoli]|uniref:3-keto-disaccharide hydrolase domain-containing protein n=1 Tax=Dictyobacter arantiisoli TaxID=2014874 RepID=A0A5A5T5H3_9CHLR|nr:hypothetical protein KDI_01660 [Dictyobacter arantiisoli]
MDSESIENAKPRMPQKPLGRRTQLRGLQPDKTVSAVQTTQTTQTEQTTSPIQKPMGKLANNSFRAPGLAHWNTTESQPVAMPDNKDVPATSTTEEHTFGSTPETQSTHQQTGPMGRLGKPSAPLNKPVFARNNTQQLPPTNNGQTGAITRQLGSPTGMLPNPNNTGTLMHPAGEYSGDTGMLKLNQNVKVVRIPVAGKPGEYKTGILPVLAQTPTTALPPVTTQNTSWQEKIKKNRMLVLLAALVVLLILGSSIFLIVRSGGTSQVANTNQKHTTSNKVQINVQATTSANAQATATFTNSLIISDPLTTNVHGWLTGYNKPIHRDFKGNAYHVRVDQAYFASSALYTAILPSKFTYSADIQEIAGDETTEFNFYGLQLNYSEKKGQPNFYIYRIINQKGASQYQFVHFDGTKAHPWSDATIIWKKNTGKEFHPGTQKNNLMIQGDGTHFTFWANGAKLGTGQDKNFISGPIGLGVNGQEKGTEIAFSNLVLAGN